MLPMTDRGPDVGSVRCPKCGAVIDEDADRVWAEVYTPQRVDGARGAETVYRPGDLRPFHRACVSWDDQDYRIVQPPH